MSQTDAAVNKVETKKVDTKKVETKIVETEKDVKEWGYLPYIGIYTLLFLLCFLGTFWGEIFAGKTLVAGADNRFQYYASLVYYSDWLRTILNNLIHGHWQIPMWDPAIAEGQDIIRTLHYYCIGEPLCLLSVFVPSDKMAWFYFALQFMRLYLSGLAFSWFALQLGHKKTWILTVASAAYTFSFYALFFTNSVPNFVLPLIFLPLILGGAERILKMQNPLPYILAVAAAALSNFYYFYVVALLTIVYSVVRCVFLYRNVKQSVIKLAVLLGYALLSVMVSSVLLLPVFFAFFGDSRLHTDYSFHLLYDWEYYLLLPAQIVDDLFFDKYVSALGLGVLPVFALVFRFFSKRRKIDETDVFLILSFLFLLFPVFGQFFNGMSYVTNRWGFAICLPGAYLFLKTESEWEVSKENWREKYSHLGIFVFLLFLVFGMGCGYVDFFARMGGEGFKWTLWKDVISVYFSLLIIYGICYAVVFKTKFFEKIKKALRLQETAVLDLYFMGFSCIYVTFMLGVAENYFLLFVLVMMIPLLMGKTLRIMNNRILRVLLIVGALFVGIFYYGYELSFVRNIKDEAFSWGELKGGTPAAGAVATEIEGDSDDSFCRYSSAEYGTNVNDISSGLSQTESFWSLTDPGLTELRYRAGLSSTKAAAFYGYDKRPVLMGLDSVKYCVTEGNKTAPYGFELKSEYSLGDGRYESVYTNDHFLSPGYTTDRYVTEEDVRELTPAELDQLMKYVLITENETGSGGKMHRMSGEEVQEILAGSASLPCEISFGEDTEYLTGGIVHVTKKGGEMYFSIKDDMPGELYVQLLGINFWDDGDDGTSVWKWRNKDSAILTLSAGETVTKYMYATDEHKYYNGMDRWAGYLGYRDGSDDMITLSFSEEGYYSFKEIIISCNPVEDYDECFDGYSKEKADFVELSTNRITGRISVSDDRMMVLPYPCIDGWSAYIDGKKADIRKVNYRHIGLEMPGGTHTFELRYETPYLKLGCGVSLMGVILLLVIEVLILCHAKREKTVVTDRKSPENDRKR